MRKNTVKTSRLGSNKINEQIKIPKLRVTGKNLDKYNLESGKIYQTNKLLEIAYENNVDLILTNEENSLCILKRYTDYLYEIKKNKKKVKTPKQKTVKFKIDTTEHDMARLRKNAINFVEKGHPVKIVLFLRGRDMKRKDDAQLKMLQLIKVLEKDVKVTKIPVLSGNRIICNILKK